MLAYERLRSLVTKYQRSGRGRSGTRPRLLVQELERRQLLSTLAFDFGTPNSPVASGYMQVTTSTRYNAAQGYGWLGGDIAGRDRGAGSDLTRDFILTRDATFAVDLPNGTYPVTVILGDALDSHDQMGVFLEGAQVDSLTAPLGQVVTHTYSVTVADGQLTLRLKDLGGPDPYVTINALSIGSNLITASFASGGPVTEGSAGSVSFTNAAGGSGGYSYGYDFNNDGSFEVTGSASAAAAIPAAYLADGPGSRVVRGRVTDSRGASAEYTTTITINNAPPSVSAGGPYSAIPGTPVSFAPTVTDPSPADQAAGFTYAWDFGDGSTSNQAAPTHNYATAGAYTVSLTVRDKDGGSTTTNTTAAVGSLAATFSNGGPVAEGSPGSVSFANVSGESGSYTYSYDFNNDGTFEVINSSHATAQVPASFLSDGPASRVVRGRVRDSSGAFTDYVTTITVNNVPPTVSAGGPYSAPLGTAVALAATVTDPSAADQAAGFTYSWDFGDGTNGTQAAPTHNYAAPGTYTVTLTARDKDGAATAATTTAVVGNYIVTQFDKIPNFGANPTITAARSGNWSDPATWSQGRVPAAGDVVSIGAGTVVTYDVVSDLPVKTVAIQSGGSLRYRTDINTRLTVINMLVMAGGELQIGTVANPVPFGVKAELIFADVPLDTTTDPQQYSNGLIALGKVTMQGAIKDQTFVRLVGEPKAGDTTLTLSQPVTGWQVGDRLVIPDTREYMDALNMGTGQWEQVTLAGISPDGRVLTLAAPLQYSHLGVRGATGNLDFTAHVGDLTRTVVVRSQSATGTRGYTLFTARADVDIRYTTFAGLGRTRQDLIDDTTFNTSGGVTHVGTNQQGRYPVYFDHLFGPSTTPANGAQFTFTGNSVFCPIDPMPFRWGVAVQDSHYGLIKDNVIYNWAGAGIVLPDGNESFNVIEHNFIVRTNGTNRRGDDHLVDHNPAREGSGIWMGNMNNYVRDNIVANASFYGYMGYGGSAKGHIPTFKGADPNQPGQFTTQSAIPVLEFARNEVYATQRGMTFWYIGSSITTTQTIAESVVKDFHVWNVQYGFFPYPINHVTFDGYVVRGTQPNLDSAGIIWADYLTANFVLRNSDIQGMKWGVMVSSKVGDTADPISASMTYVIENTYLRNVIDVYAESMNGVTGGGSHLAKRTVIMRNVKFDHVSGAGGTPLYDIYLNFLTTGRANFNWIQQDEFYVYDYNQIAGNNFRVYYNEQAAGFILPQTSANGLGSPVAGLTNQQNWDTYGIAVAGSIAPSSATTRPGIYGLVV